MKIIITLLLSFKIMAISPGDNAPDFTVLNDQGKLVSLKEYRGKKVILEWYNHGCPFVRKHYDSSNMQETQKFAISKGFIWLSINSSNIDKQGYIPNAAYAHDRLKYERSNANAMLIDTDGKVGRLYNAKTTPEIFIISETGKILYMGAIDSIASADKDDIKSAENYVKSAIKDLAQGNEVRVKRTKPYGCSVKY
ncbi:redoxin domain-containing protein [Bacteriovorax sp. Seq25_V]|uniref:redoxin domain-containing protein n=1 Tax=Bacteriovorax sp. Seq25_V TaxID=1201288 RepID=UPI000389EBB7|nr:redoxin domain-containing protein [Bacteriovorax sp. Seq25_V]EQC43812.1 redoxin [Bacteriovorax sp. Seq25_V]